MFLGHFGVALAAKRAAPHTSLGTLVAASTLIDLVWPVLLLAGVEEARVVPGTTAFTPLEFTSYPVTHSAVTVAVWGVLFGAVYLWRTGNRTGAKVAGALVASHWVLDALVHVPDLPLWPGGPEIGLSAWNSIPATLALELSFFLVGLAVYVSATRPRGRAGRWVLAALVAFLAAVYAASALGPPPESTEQLGTVGLLAWLFVPWAAWADRHRQVSAEVRSGPVPVP